ncbi:tryptophan--tRNA ligase [Nanoarchaeota archaeon]
MMPEDFKVTPWEVSGNVDYNKLVKDFGTEIIDDAMLKRLQKHTGDLHFMLKRKVFFSHRDMKWLLDEYEKKNPFYLYTGRGPSGHTHIGHLVSWVFTRWLQEKFKCKLTFQLTDDEKFLFKQNLSLEQANKYAYENALDLVALGFKPKDTQLIIDTEYAKTMYPQALRIAKKITLSTAKAAFGFGNDSNLGQIFYTSMQAVPSFLESVKQGKNVPCLVTMAIDQDPHFRVARDVIPKLGYHKPALMHCRFLPGLGGPGKMSSSAEDSAQSTIYTTDDPKTIKKKINKYAFSGGKVTVEEHRKHGGNPDIDVSYQWLNMFFEPDDGKLKSIHDDYSSGKMLTGELKQILIEKVEAFLTKHQDAREKAKDKIEDFIVRD